jgi:hypothetical protein
MQQKNWLRSTFTQEAVGYATPLGEYPLPTTQEWGEGQGEGKSNKQAILSPALSSLRGGEGEARRRLYE